MSTTPSLPSWFEQAFGHLTHDDRQIAARLWTEEPALRLLVQRLDSYLPSRWKPPECPMCENTHIRWTNSTDRGVKIYFCSACQQQFVATLGTPFYNLLQRSYVRLYSVAVALWGPWTPFFAWKIAGCSDSKQLAQYRKRLVPLLEDLEVQPLVSRPAYRWGFSPADQGIRCLRCQSDAIAYSKRHDPDNPGFKCNSCGYGFFLSASRRHLLPIPDNVCCPGCEGRSLVKKTERADCRVVYRCRDCYRSFIFPAKKFQPSKYGRNNDRPVPNGVTARVS